MVPHPQLLRVNMTQNFENFNQENSSLSMIPTKEYQFDRQASAQEDFKLLIKYVKMWKKYVKHQKLVKI